MKQAAVVRRALRATDHTIHRRRHGLALLREEVRRVVASDRGHISCYSLQAPPGRRRRRGGLARAEPVEERGHLALREAVNMLSGLETALRVGRRLTDGRSDQAGTRRCRGVPQAVNGSQARPGSWLRRSWLASALHAARFRIVGPATDTDTVGAIAAYAAPAPNIARNQDVVALPRPPGQSDSHYYPKLRVGWERQGAVACGCIAV